MSEIIKSFEGVTAGVPGLFRVKFDFVPEDNPAFTKVDPASFDNELISNLFKIYEAFCDEALVCDGEAQYSEEEIDKDLLSKQALIFGYEGRGLIGSWDILEGDPDDLERVIGFKFQLKFDLENIEAPNEPFVQLRLLDVVDGRIVVLDETFFEYTGINVVSSLLTGTALDVIAHKSVKGFLPDCLYETSSDD